MITIIGAGPAGLSTAYYLQKEKLSCRILEKESIGHSWQSHYDSLRLHTLKGVSALPGLPMPEGYPPFPDKDQVVDYLRTYAAHFDLDVQEGVEVRAARQQAGNGCVPWQLDTSQGRMTSDVLIVATGIWDTPVCPRLPGQEQFRGEICHVNAYKNPTPFRGRRVLVVGAGNSGTEIATELGEAGIETGIAIRSGVTFVRYPQSAWFAAGAALFARHAPAPLTNFLLERLRPTFEHLGIPEHPEPPTKAYPVVGLEFPAAVAAGQVTVHGDIERLLPTGVRFADGSETPFDTIILATGYRPTIDFIQPTPQLDERGHLTAASRAIHPNLYCVGFYYPATEGWLQSVGRFARETVRRVRRDQQQEATRTLPQSHSLT